MNRRSGGSTRREQDRPVPWRFRLILFGIGVVTWVVHMGLRGRPELVERFYSRGLYPVFRELIGTLTGWTSFSLAEGITLLLALVLILRAVRLVRALTQRRRSPRNAGAHLLSGSLALAGVLYAAGMLVWGFNYYRQPFVVTENLDRTGIDAEELRGVCLDLVQRANALRREVEEDADGVMTTHDGARRALARARAAFDAQGLEYASLRDGFVSRPKVPMSGVLPWLNVAGMFIPYTGEPNVAMGQPVPGRLFSACHEMAHQLGWAREEEANFIGYAVCRRHPDADYRYAAIQGALRYALAGLRRVDGDAAAAVSATIGPGMQRDWDAARRFWLRYETRFGEAAMQVNDAYLKAQGQEAGLQSYGLMVDLLVADHRRRGYGSPAE